MSSSKASRFGALIQQAVNSATEKRMSALAAAQLAKTKPTKPTPPPPVRPITRPPRDRYGTAAHLRTLPSTPTPSLSLKTRLGRLRSLDTRSTLIPPPISAPLRRLGAAGGVMRTRNEGGRLRRPMMKGSPRITTTSIEIPPDGLPLSILAHTLGLKSRVIISDFRAMGETFQPTRRSPRPSGSTWVSHELAELMALEHNVTVKPSTQLPELISHATPSALSVHHPIVITVLGHVDHGKSSLIAALRSSHCYETTETKEKDDDDDDDDDDGHQDETSVKGPPKKMAALNEAGGITQQLAAMTFHPKSGMSDASSRPVTLIDTPGHVLFGQAREVAITVAQVAVILIDPTATLSDTTLEVLQSTPHVPKLLVLSKGDLYPERHERASLVKRLSAQLANHGYSLQPHAPPGTSSSSRSSHSPSRHRAQDEEHVLPYLVCSGKTGEGLEALLTACGQRCSLPTASSTASTPAPATATETGSDVNDAIVPGEATVLDVSISKTSGLLVHALVTGGDLSVGQVLCGPGISAFGTIRQLFNQHQVSVDSIPSGFPATIAGLSLNPLDAAPRSTLLTPLMAGQVLLPIQTELAAIALLQQRETRARAQENALSSEHPTATAVSSQRPSYDVQPTKRTVSHRAKKILFIQRRDAEQQELERVKTLSPGDQGYQPKQVHVGLKVASTALLPVLEALLASLPSHPTVALNVVSLTVGPRLTLKDLRMAVACSTPAYFTFQCSRPTNDVLKSAVNAGVDITTTEVIYQLKDELIQFLTKSLAPIVSEKVVGRANVQEVLTLRTKKSGGSANLHLNRVAGCKVVYGKLGVNAKISLRRNDGVIASDLTVASLKHFKQKVSHINIGQECGLVLNGTTAVEAGDVLEITETVSVPDTLVEQSDKSGDHHFSKEYA